MFAYAGGCVCKVQWQSKTYHAPSCGTEKYLLKDKVITLPQKLNSGSKTVIVGIMNRRVFRRYLEKNVEM